MGWNLSHRCRSEDALAALEQVVLERLPEGSRASPYGLSSPGRQQLHRILAELRDKYDFLLLGYVVMPEHVHLIISEPKELTPSRVLQILKRRVSRRMRGKRRSVLNQQQLRFPEEGPGLRQFWQRRFYDFNIYTRKKLTEKLEYMHSNPVKRKLVRRPQDCQRNRIDTHVP